MEDVKKPVVELTEEQKRVAAAKAAAEANEAKKGQPAVAK